MNHIDAHVAAVKALAGYGITAVSAEEIVSSVEESQPEEWTRTLDRVANGDAKRVRLFVVWNDIGNFATFLYSGSQDATVAFMFRSLAEIVSGEQVKDDLDLTDPANVQEGEVEGYNPVACFDIGRELNALTSKDIHGTSPSGEPECLAV